MSQPTERDLKNELIKVTIENNQAQRHLRAADAKKNFAMTRCYSYDDYMCKADNMRPCMLQCYDRDVEIQNPKTKDEKLVRK